MSDHDHQLVGLIGFIVSGLAFLVPAVQDVDVLALISSATWLGGCGFWLVPVLRAKRAADS